MRDNLKSNLMDFISFLARNGREQVLKSKNILFPLQCWFLIFVYTRSNFSTYLSDAREFRIPSEQSWV